MKKEIKALTLCYLSVLLLLMISSRFNGFLQIIIYILAFIAPAITTLILFCEKEKISISSELGYLRLGKDKMLISVLIIAPTLLLILGASFLTSFIIFALFGRESTVSVTADPLTATLMHALLPAILEELAFRYLPLKMLAKKSPRAAVFASAFFFSLIHRSFFSIPYAFLAGFLFMAIDIASSSVLPSVIIHFLNNVLALMTMGVYGFTLKVSWAFAVVGLLTLVCSVFLFIERRKLLQMASSAFALGEGYGFSKEPLFFALPALIIAVSELLI